MGYILSIETAVKGCSVAVHQNGDLITDVNLHNERVASSLLTTAIKHVMELADTTFSELKAVAISAGPGSYTGLRIGLSTAKGLCFSLEKPLIALNTLEIMTQAVHGLFSGMDMLCPLIDARRMEVYGMMFDAETRQVREETAAKVVDETTFAEILEQKRILFFGTGSQKIQSLYAAQSNATFITKEVYPAAALMGKLAYAHFHQHKFAPVADFEPVYVKPYFATTPKNKLRP